MRPCSRCGVQKPLEGFYRDSTKKDGHHTVCIVCALSQRKIRYHADPTESRARMRSYYQRHRGKWLDYARKLRADVLAAYGGRCMCCGEDTPEFLGIDHVNNDGEKHRAELKGYGRSIYRWLKSEGYPQDGRFQLLCHNCNMAKGLYGGCPHNGPVPYKRHKDMAA